MQIDSRARGGLERALSAILLLVAGGAGSACGPGSSTGDGADSPVEADTEADADADDGADAEPDGDSGIPGDLDLVPYVDPFIGTDDSDSPHPVPGGAGGSTYPGAVVPFGMVQLGPDTPTASPSGYRHSDREIEQFSLTHFDGAGCPNNEDLPFLPVVHAMTISPGTNWTLYRAGCAKTDEVATPGSYRVHLDGYDIEVELTATTRTGFARFTYPSTDLARVMFQTGLSATGAFDGSIEILAPDRIRGTVTAGAFCGSDTSFRIHFVAVFDRPFSGHGTWLGGALSPGSSEASGLRSGGYVTFDTTSSPVVQMKIGLSFVSVANAEANLEAENPGWDFDAVRARAAAEWNAVLNRVQVTGGSDDDLRKFYTALYHVFQNPNVASDVNGEYLGFDGRVHVADGIRYQNFSGWDIIRSWTHLVAALAPEAPEIIESMVQDGVESGLLPFWTHQNVETHVMVGDPGTVNVANAHAMGVRGFDTDAALQLMRRSAEDPLHTARWALENWLDVHHVGNAAVSLEYAMADFALASRTCARRSPTRSGWRCPRSRTARGSSGRSRTSWGRGADDVDQASRPAPLPARDPGRGRAGGPRAGPRLLPGAVRDPDL